MSTCITVFNGRTVKSGIKLDAVNCWNFLLQESDLLVARRSEEEWKNQWTNGKISNFVGMREYFQQFHRFFQPFKGFFNRIIVRVMIRVEWNSSWWASDFLSHQLTRKSSEFAFVIAKDSQTYKYFTKITLGYHTFILNQINYENIFTMSYSQSEIHVELLLIWFLK